MADVNKYSLLTGIWKTIKNGLVLFWPSILAFILALPEEVQIKYALPIGLLSYFVKNYLENRK